MKKIACFLCFAGLMSWRSPESFHTSLHNYHEEYLKLYPFVATSAGDNRYNDLLPNNISVAYRNQVKDFYSGYQEKLNAIDKSTLTEDNRLSYDLLMYQCNINLEGLKFNDH